MACKLTTLCGTPNKKKHFLYTTLLAGGQRPAAILHFWR